MIYILYNPYSRNGNKQKYHNHIKRLVTHKNQSLVFLNMLELGEVESFQNTLQHEDELIIIGGDGTIHHLMNQYDLTTIPQKVWMYQGGTGNDFLRSIPIKGPLIPIQKYLYDLPIASFNEKTYRLINGAGLGLDGYVGHVMEESRQKKTKFHFFKATLKGLLKFHPFQATITSDHTTKSYETMWFTAVMHRPYFGGGMKIAPHKNKHQHLDVVIVKEAPKWLLLIIFPSIYLGKHLWFKKYVEYYEAKEVSIVTDKNMYGQMDGEVIFTQSLTIKK
jgi:diacylglycerol kinase (ATP)